MTVHGHSLPEASYSSIVGKNFDFANPIYLYTAKAHEHNEESHG